jgi:hypothetical protein
VKDAVVVLVKELIVFSTHNITDHIKSFGTVTEQYILAAILHFIDIAEHLAQLRFIKFRLYTLGAPDGAAAPVIRVRCFYINGLKKDVVKIYVLEIIIQEHAKLKAFLRKVQVIGFVPVFDEHFSVANNVQVISHDAAAVFNSLDFPGKKVERKDGRQVKLVY